MSLTRSLIIFAACLVICTLTVQSASVEEDNMVEGEWNEEYERLAEDDEAFSFDNAEEEELMEERQANNQKNIKELWREANPIAWTIKRL
ncbi:hypothetical protein DAPPUDRAFT_301595 [Daphnia pulex]|uniref:Uncharacterized protein n=1 Tax=Daphnia pulex TaxID=6669 RepID=E9GA82_DAPPU|nr:hypothetical protein DAPPUDRAFT_301595 [Daphnia pulex]|eukprot:EFX83697.1 hypothetical protein DAPPUDRAFT_301595 [Daphnia pulex]